MSITVSCQNYGCVKNLFPVFMIVKSRLNLLSYWLKRYLRFSLYLSPQSLWKAGKEHVSSNKTSKHHLGSCLCFFCFELILICQIFILTKQNMDRERQVSNFMRHQSCGRHFLSQSSLLHLTGLTWLQQKTWRFVDLLEFRQRLYCRQEL